MTEHTLRQYDIELEEIRRGVLNMGGLAEAQVVKAIEVQRSGQLDLLDTVIEGDKPINLAQVELDDDCSHIIAKRQPTASDLRLVLAVIKIASDLERIGDEAKKIAKMARDLHRDDTRVVPRVNLRPAANIAVAMLRRALDAFARLDANASAEVVRQDREVDAGFKAAMRQLITFMMEDPRTISSSLDLLFVARSIERIGDHAKNISEYVVYLVKGRDVRHIGLDAIEQEIAR